MWAITTRHDLQTILLLAFINVLEETRMPRFLIEEYRRDDTAQLTHRIVDAEYDIIIDDAMSADEATTLAEAMNQLHKHYHGSQEAL